MTKPTKMRAFKHEKLWRDKMPAYCEAKGSIITIKPLDDQEFDRELRIKLLEEADEVKEALSEKELVEELADLYEVVDTIIASHGINKKEILAVQEKKRVEKGGFMQRTYVTVARHPVGSYSESYCLAQPEKYPEIKE